MSRFERRVSEGSIKQAAHRKARQIHEITRSGLVSDLENFLSSSEIDVNYEYCGQNAGHIAVEVDSFEKFQMLLQKGLDLNSTNEDGNTLLHLACENGNHQIAQSLIDSGAKLDIGNDTGLTPLMTSTLKDDVKMMQLLLTAGADPNIPDSRGRPLLMVCVENGWILRAQTLLDGGCLVDQPDEDLRSALMVAVEQGNKRAVDILWASGANVNHRSRENVNALFEAASRGQYEMVQYLTEKGADIDVRSNNFITPLIESVSKRRLDVVNYLILVGADVNLTGYNKQSPLHVAVKQAVANTDTDTIPVHICRSLLNASCLVDIQNNEGHTPLYLAVSGGHLELTEEILTRKPRLDLLTKSGDSLVHGAIRSGEAEVVNTLVEAGADVTSTNQRGESPLFLATKTKVDFAILELLVASRADLDVAENREHRTALMAAVTGQYREAVKLLCEAGCDVNIPDSQGCTPLNRACDLKDIDVVRQLLMTSQCDVQGSGNNRPLLTAIKKGSYKIVEMLIEAGCDMNVIDDDGNYAMYLAAENNVPSLVKLLLKHGADPDVARSIRSANCCLKYSDPHPHLEISPLYIAVKNDAIGILSVLLQCYSPLPYHDLGYLHDILFTTSFPQEAHMAQNIENILRGIFGRVLFNAPSLMMLCRNVCRKALGSRPHQKVDELDIPRTLKDFVLMKDVFKS